MKNLATLIRNGDARVWSIVSASLLLATAGWSQTLTWLGTLGGSQSYAFGVSADGSVVVGWADNAAGQWRAFRWTRATGMQDLGTLPGGSGGWAYGVSADGSVVVGWADNAAGQRRAFRWQNGVMQDLGTLGGDRSEAYGVSADGSVVVGWAASATGRHYAFRWTQQTGMQALGDFSPSYAYAISADRSTVVGLYAHPFRWTQQTGMQIIDQNMRTGGSSIAYAVSADGSVVVGVGSYGTQTEHTEYAFRWTQQTGVQLIGPPASEAYGVSADGSVVVGATPRWFGAAFRWTQATGVQDLNQVYASLLTDGSRLWYARAISPDGRYIVGLGYNAATRRGEAFLLDTAPRRAGDVNGDGCVNDVDLLRVLFAFGNTGANLPEDLNGDNTVNDADLLEVLFNFGRGCN